MAEQLWKEAPPPIDILMCTALDYVEVITSAVAYEAERRRNAAALQSDRYRRRQRVIEVDESELDAEVDDLYFGDGDLHYTVCRRCGQPTARVLSVTPRSGESREVCAVCRADAMSGDRDYWRWHHHGT